VNHDKRLRFAGSALFVCLFGGAIPAHAQQPQWIPTGSFVSPHIWHTATLLANGKVLVAGGTDYFSSSRPYWRGISTAELYDPATGEWSATGDLHWPRGGHIAVRLADGRVLVAGGDNGYLMPVTQTEIYDPNTGQWRGAGDLRMGWGSTATLLLDGKVLVMGAGSNAVLYNPTDGSWHETGSTNARRASHLAILLPSGQVLVVGGFRAGISTELYDPGTGTWKITGNLNIARYWDHQAALLPNGNVLVFGGGIGGDDYCNGVSSAEIYDTAQGTWSLTDSAISTRNDYGMANYSILLPTGKVLVGGGLGPGCVGLKSADLYDPVTERWGVTASMLTARSGHTVTLLENGKVLAAGGDAGNTAEIYEDVAQ